MLRELLAGAANTVQLATVGWAIGLPFGFAMAFWCLYFPPMRTIIRIIATGIVIIPALAILFWLHYPLQAILGVVWPPTVTVLILLAFYVMVVSADIFSTQMSRIEAEHLEQALVLGIGHREFVLKILLWSAVDRALPGLLSLGMVSIHMTMFASLIGVEELFRVTQRLNAQLLRPVELYTVMAIFYAALCIPLYVAAFALARKLQNAGR